MKKWFLFPLILLLASCSPKVVSYLSSTSKFSRFETYRLVSTTLDSKNVSPKNVLFFDLIKANIHAEMSKRSYKTSNISPDLTMRYWITSSMRVEKDRSLGSGGYNVPSFSQTTQHSILLMELYDQNKKLVWQGSSDLNIPKKEKKVPKTIETAVGYIFTTYPYRAKSATVDETLKIIERKKKNKK